MSRFFMVHCVNSSVYLYFYLYSSHLPVLKSHYPKLRIQLAATRFQKYPEISSAVRIGLYTLW